jgi:hypothetical protein
MGVSSVKPRGLPLKNSQSPEDVLMLMVTTGGVLF